MASFSVRPSLSASRFTGFSRSGLSIASFNTTRRIALLHLGSGMNLSVYLSHTIYDFRPRSFFILTSSISTMFCQFSISMTSPRSF